MSGIFPNAQDGAVSCEVAQPPGYCPTTPPLVPALYYGSGCDVRLRPEVLNSLISEQIAVIDEARIAYNPNRRENLDDAIRYLIQRGLPHSGQLGAGPNNYTLVLDPSLTSYNNHLTLVVVPNVDNAGAVTINVDGRGAVPVLRNDGLSLRTQDFRRDRPEVLSFWNGNFHVVGLVASQVPIVLSNNIDLWVRPDGNDGTGDGSENTAGRAYRTIDRAFQSFASRFAVSPAFQINIRLGIPGDYEACAIVNCENTVNIIGDIYNAAGYRIRTRYHNPPLPTWTYCVHKSRVNCWLRGVTLAMDQSAIPVNALHSDPSTNVFLHNCRFEVLLQNIYSNAIYTHGYCQVFHDFNLVGYGRTMRSWLTVWNGSFRSFEENDQSDLIRYRFENVNFDAGGIIATHAGSIAMVTNSLISINTTGYRWLADLNAIIEHWRVLPGSVDGILGSGAQYRRPIP